jgi:hypothetical protein
LDRPLNFWFQYKFIIFHYDINNKRLLGLEICNRKLRFMNFEGNISLVSEYI